MPKLVSLGYKVPNDDCVEIEDFVLSISGKPVDIDTKTRELTWSFENLVSAEFIVRTEIMELARQCGFPSFIYTDYDQYPQFGLSINWKCSKTGLHGASRVQPLVDGSQSIEIELPGKILGGTVSFTTSIVLQDNPLPNLTPLAPKLAGSKLWSQTVSIELEGAGSQFPTSAYDFKEYGIEPHQAMWILEVDRNLSLHVAAAIRLRLNTAHSRVKQYMSDPAAPDSVEFRKFLDTDVVRQLLLHALSFEPSELQQASEDPGSLAEALVSIHTIVFGAKSLETTKSEFEADPSEFFARIQAHYFSAK